MSDHRYLKRLDRRCYRGMAHVHWAQTLDGRATGWLDDLTHLKFRELLTHMLGRFGLACPIYCCMPDHFHLLLIGITKGSDQLNAIAFFRKQLNIELNRIGFRLQKQPYDRVLRNEERQAEQFTDLVEYIARNPERAGLVGQDEFKSYKYTGALMPGYPDLYIWSDDYWPRFWSIYSKLRRYGLVRSYDEDIEP